VSPAILVVLALGLGLSTNLLGAGRTIHVLWNPVLGLVAWSLAVYALVLVRLPRVGAGDADASPLVALLLRGRAWLERRGADLAEAELERRLRFAAAWARTGLPLRLARARLALHLGAALIALGALGGMYLRGLVFEYRATWESTFLSEAGVERALRVVLAPALLARGGELPDLAAMRAPEGSAPAAPWVHLYAWTVVWLVVVPRALLALREARRARRRAAAVALDARQPYFRRLLAPARGESKVALVAPYGRALEPPAAERLRALLGELLGTRAEVELVAPAAYGAEGGELFAAARGDGRARTLVVVFPLAQTPESEVHGRLLAELKDALEPDETLLVLVDAAGYRAQTADRVAERRGAWERVASAEGLAAAHVDLDPRAPEAAIDALEGALWSAAR
jgi:rhodanese-related sulfurtransferase